MKRKLSNSAYVRSKLMCMSVDCLGRIEKGVKCSVSGCGREAARSIPSDKVRAAGLNVGSADKRAYICKEHYKEYKKKTKKDKTIEKWRHGT